MTQRPASSRTTVVVFAVAGALAVGAIGYALGTRRAPEAPTTPPSAAASSVAVPNDIPTGGPASDDVRPVYPMLAPGASAAPQAVALCDAIYALPIQRRAACCGTPKSSGLAGECARNLSGALTSSQVELDDKAVTTCVAALAKQHEGCDWVVALSNGQPLPKECEAIVKGKLTTGAVCRSGYECADGLACHGAGPTAAGRCGPPKTQGSCNLGVDVLGTYLRDRTFERRHPECAGYCLHRACTPSVKMGEACQSSDACGPTGRCIDGKCAPTVVAKKGDSCESQPCGEGLRCVGGRCAEPLREGETCQSDAQCRGRCRPTQNGEGRTCSATCQVELPTPPNPRR